MTVFGDGRININTAPKPVLRALATEMTDGEVEWLDRYRRDVRNDLAECRLVSEDSPGIRAQHPPAG